uniref:Helitron helicase-like domain-containing protein n=1 Tax=Trichogramma kaykai TaxID=54128 RepID=A0ABD2W6D6_9HYME
MMREEIKKQENAQTLQELQLLFSIKDDLDKRRYNCQQSNEVAAIFSTTADGDIPDAYVVVRNKNTKELKKISTMDPKVDSSVYPLFNPYGQKGWHENIAKKNSEGNVSRAAYTKYNIAIRDNFNPLLRGRRLFQQYVVDTYVKIEKDRIEYCKSHQDVLKVSSYKSLIEYVKKKAQGLENARVAEIPNPDRYPKLHEIVINHMIHGPCGDRCLNNGSSKKFPKPYQDETIIDSNSYPIYRRRNTNQIYVRKNNHKVDNRNVVPYCPELLLMFNYHINVEVCSSIQSIKYLHKYICKGHNAASVVITNNDEGTIVNHDEIKTYINARYVGPSEAVWRILSKPLHDKSHVIIRLPVHLPNYHNVVIHTDPHIEDAESALN